MYNILKISFIVIIILLATNFSKVSAQQLGSNWSAAKHYVDSDINYPQGKTIKLNKLDLNKASLQQLMSLPCINEDMALKIIRRRPIKSLEDLYNLAYLDVSRVKIILKGITNLVVQPPKPDTNLHLKQ